MPVDLNKPYFKMSAEPTIDDSARQKSELEIEKLKADIRVAKRSPWFAPTTILSGVIALVAVGGYLIQHSLLNFDLKQAQLDKTRLDNELTESRYEKKHLDEDNERLKAQLQAEKGELETTKGELSALRSRFNGNILSFGKVVPLGQDINIEGIVINLDGQPVQNASVRIFRLGNKYVPTASKEISTNPDGDFSYAIPSGPPFTLLVSAPGIGESNFLNLAGDCSHRFRIVLAPPLGAQPPALGNP